jgi:biotin operon repressor
MMIARRPSRGRQESRNNRTLLGMSWPLIWMTVGPTWEERILEVLSASSEPLDDDTLASMLGASRRQTINQVCRRLEAQGMTTRRAGTAGKIVNTLALTASSTAPRPQTPLPSVPVQQTSRETKLLTEDSIKAAVKNHLETAGWNVTVAWGRERGVDIEAHRGTEHLYLEAKGEASNPPQQVNYFLSALGELVQRLRDPSARYGLALPDHPQYRRLVERLSHLAWERLNLIVMLVDRQDEKTITILRNAR